MELVVVLFVLYGVQCVGWLPRGAVLFQRALGSWTDVRGPGWCLWHPLPGAAAVVGRRLPVVEEAGRLHGRGGATWASGAPGRRLGPALLPGSGQQVEARGRVVRVDGRPLAGCASPEEAAALASRLAGLLSRPGGERAWIGAELERSLSLERFAEARERLARETVALRRLSAAYLAILFAALPAAIPVLHEERALLLALPPLGVLHVATLVALGIARRRLLGDRASLGEVLFAAALYPPLLLRGLADLCAAVLSGFHPALVAAAMLPEDEARAHLRAEWLHLGTPEADSSLRLGIAALEREALRGLIESRGDSLDGLLAPPPRSDAVAQAFCPACRSEYRRSTGLCSDCGLALVAYPEIRAMAGPAAPR